MRLIDADALCETLGVDAKECPKCQYGVSIYGYCTRGDEFQHVCEAIDDAPTVDAVPVVRCADCIRFFPDDDVWGWCTVSGKMRCKDYCSYGVREDGDDEQTKKPE